MFEGLCKVIKEVLIKVLVGMTSGHDKFSPTWKQARPRAEPSGIVGPVQGLKVICRGYP